MYTIKVMEALYLKKISKEDKQLVLNYITEMVENGSRINGLRFYDSKSFEEMLENFIKQEAIKFENYEQDNYPYFQYLLMRQTDNAMVGAVGIRPYMTKYLDEIYGGNIGYSIRPSERRKGYATKALQLAIQKCYEINQKDEIIVCCYKDNIGSRKAIIKNGGILIEEKPGTISRQKYIIKKTTPK